MKIKFCNKFIFLLVILYILIAFGNFNVFAAVKDTFTVGDLTYTILTDPQEDMKGTVSVKQNTTTTISVTIPSNIINNSNSYDVTAIANNAFSDNVMSNIIIPDSVTNIGEYAFKGCYNLTNIIIPNSVTEIGEFSFSNCYKLENISLPNNLKVIEDNLFEECYSLKKIELPESLEKIERFAFAGCYGIREIVMLENIMSIGKLSFSRCKGLKKITILSDNFIYFSPSNILYENELVDNIEIYIVNEITKNTLRDCCYIPESKITIINNFIKDGFSYRILTEPQGNKRGTVGIGKPWGDFYVDSIVIPSYVINNNKRYDVVSIRSLAFIASEAKTISIPNGITKIGSNAFENCFNLTSLKIPDSVIEIGDRAFSNCYALKNITLSNNLKSLEQFLFSNCAGLESIQIPESVTLIESVAFNLCKSLTEIVIPPNVTYIDSPILGECSKLKSITILSDNIKFRYALYGISSDVSKDIKIYVVNKKVKKALADVGTPENIIEIIGTKTITDFVELNENIKKQEVANGTSLSSLNLPTSLKVVVGSKIETINDFIWIYDKTYEPTAAGEYIFTATLLEDSIYVIDTNVQIPTIKVTIKPKTITNFETISEEISTQKVEIGTNLNSLNLPASLKATVDEKEETLMDITWTCNKIYNPIIAGTYLFTMNLPSDRGYIIQSGLEVPTIEIIIVPYTIEQLNEIIRSAQEILNKENLVAEELLKAMSDLADAIRKYNSNNQ